MNYFFVSRCQFQTRDTIPLGYGSSRGTGAIFCEKWQSRQAKKRVSIFNQILITCQATHLSNAKTSMSAYWAARTAHALPALCVQIE